jgi:hypothetical protein
MFTAAALLLLFVPSAHATTFLDVPFPDAVKDAPVIVHGQVGASAADWSKDGNGSRRIYTFYDVDVSEVLKGDAPTGHIQMREMGGVKDGVGLQVAGASTYQPGEDVVVFLGERNSDGSFDVRGMMMGKYNVVKDANGQAYLSGPGVNPILAHGHTFHPEDNAGSRNDTQPAKKWTLEDLRQVIRDQGSAPQGARNTEASAPVHSPAATPPPATPVMEQTAPPLQPSSTQEPPKDDRGAPGLLTWLGLAWVLGVALLGAFLLIRRSSK